LIRKSRITNECYDTQTPRYSGYAKAACDWRHGLVIQLTGIGLEYEPIRDSCSDQTGNDGRLGKYLLGSLVEQMVFLGGCATGLLILENQQYQQINVTTAICQQGKTQSL
jgi:hypothetical protein